MLQLLSGYIDAVVKLQAAFLAGQEACKVSAAALLRGAACAISGTYPLLHDCFAEQGQAYVQTII